ncbi:MAG: hypothetical protein QXQ46_09295, partial [Thermoplasmatales archaeon]
MNRTSVSKVVAVSLILLFLISGLSGMVYGSPVSNHNGTGSVESVIKTTNSIFFNNENHPVTNLLDYQNPKWYTNNFSINSKTLASSINYSNQTHFMYNGIGENLKFVETGLPAYYSLWEVQIIKDTNVSCTYFGNYSSTNQNMSISLPNGTYKYIAFSANNMYTTSSATGKFSIPGNETLFYIPFKISPLSLYQLSPTEIGSSQTLTFNQSSYGTGPRALSFGVINSIVKIEVYNGSQLILNKTVSGLAQFNVTEISTRSYAFVNFFSDGQNIKIIFTNVGAITGYIRYDFWDYYISNYTASLATVPPQFALNLAPQSNFAPIYNNTGIAFTFVAPYYKEPVALALWIGEGFYNPVTGKNWWAQVGFNNWLGGMNDVSYAGWGIFSNIFGNPGGTDGAFPLVPNETYNISMEMVSGDIWGFFANGKPIIEPGLDGYFNTTSDYANGNIDLGLEFLTLRAGSPSSTSLLTTTVKVLKAMQLKVGNKWESTPSFEFNEIGEDWYTFIGTSVGLNLFGVEGNIQNKSIPNGSIVFGNSDEPLFDIPTFASDMAYPLFGNFVYPYGNLSSGLDYVNARILANGSIFINPQKGQVLVTLMQYEQESGILENFSNYVINGPRIIRNPYLYSKETLSVTLSNNTDLWGYGGRFQEIVITQLKKYNVEFTETGLPSGAAWNVTLNGVKQSSSTSSITFSEPNGSYSYTVGIYQGY